MIVRTETLSEVRDKHKNETIVLAGGVFDLMHPGHIDLFKRMKQAADIVVVALSSDKRVKERKGQSRPIHDQQTRLELVDSVKYVDYSLIAPEPNELEVPTVQIMRSLRPDIFMSCEDSWFKYPEIFKELGINFVLIPRFSEEISTTKTIEKIRSLS